MNAEIKNPGRNRFYIILVSVLSIFGVSFLGGNVINLFAIKLGANEFELGLIPFLAMAPVAFRLLTMAAVEKYGKRKVLTAGYWSSALMVSLVLVLALLLHYEKVEPRFCLYAVMVVLFMQGVCEQCGSTGWFPIIQDNLEPGTTGQFFARLRTCWQSAGLISVLLIAWYVGEQTTWGHFVLLFSVGVAAFVLRALAIMFVEERRSTIKTGHGGVALQRVKEVFASRSYRGLILYMVVYMAGFACAEPFKIKMLKNLGYGDNVILAATAMMALGAILSLHFWGKLADRYGNRSLFSISHIGMIVVTLCWLLVDANRLSQILIFFLYLVNSVFHSGNGIAQTRYFMHAVPTHKQNHINILNMVSSLTAALAPLVGGVFLNVSGGVRFVSGAVALNHYHLLFMISAVLFTLSHFLRRKLRVSEEVPTSQVIAMVMQNMRSLFSPFVRLREQGEDGESESDNRIEGE